MAAAPTLGRFGATQATQVWAEVPGPTRVALHIRRELRRRQQSPYPSSTGPPVIRYPAPSRSTTQAATASIRLTPVLEDEEARAQADADTTASAILWNLAGPTPTHSAMHTPTVAAHQQVQEQESEEEVFERALTEVNFAGVLSGKHHTAQSPANNVAHAKKRSRPSTESLTMRSPTMSSLMRSSPMTETRPRPRNKRHRASLPDERERYPTSVGLGRNPWALSSDEEGVEGERFGDRMDPVATSTPVLRHDSAAILPHVPSDDEFFLDQANMSGCPPTPHHMQQSSFVESLRRSAGEAHPLNQAQRLQDRSFYLGGIADRRLPRSGGSSPLPPSSPISIDTPSRRSASISEDDAQDLFSRNKMRLSSLLADPEGPNELNESSRRSAKHPRDLRIRGEAGGRYSEMEDRPPPATQAPRNRWQEEAGERGSSRREAVLHTRPSEEPSVFVALPNTRAALHLQEQIAARAAELAKNRMPSRKPAPLLEASVREQSVRAPDARTWTGPRTQSAMDAGMNTPRSAMSVVERSEPLDWEEMPLDEESRWSAAPQGHPGALKLPSQEPEDPPMHNGGDEADTSIPYAIPTILTAAAPEVDHPMFLDCKLSHPVHRDDPEAIIRGVSRRWVETIWSDPPRTSVLLETFNFAYTDSIQANRIMVETLRQAVYLIAGAENVMIVPPDLEDSTTRRPRDAPRVWAVRGLTQAQESAMLARFPWSFRAISFFTYKRAITPDVWLLALDGFFDEDVIAITSAVREVLEEPDNWERLAALTRDHPTLRHLQARDRVNRILDSIVVKTWRLSNRNVVANVYIDPPTLDVPKWREWAGGLRLRTYGNFVNGTGVVRRIAACLGCNSVDHPAHRCPFPELSGWNGPRAGTGQYSTLPPPPPPPAPAPPPATQHRGQNPPHRGRVDARTGYTQRGAAPRTPARWRPRG